MLSRGWYFGARDLIFWLRVLRRAGIVDRVRAAGIEVKDMAWRELGGQYVSDRSSKVVRVATGG